MKLILYVIHKGEISVNIEFYFKNSADIKVTVEVKVTRNFLIGL